MPRSEKPEKKMDLILWRHAEAEEATGGLPDERRRLTARGEKQAADMGQWLKKRLPKKVRILVSPTERTQMTAHALGLPFEIEKRIGSGATAGDLLAAAGWPDEGGTVLIVGHQPTLGRVAAALLCGREEDWTIKKGALWWFMNRPGRGNVGSVLKVALSPDLI
jgi:phosphohistidine phosphatase